MSLRSLRRAAFGAGAALSFGACSDPATSPATSTPSLATAAPTAGTRLAVTALGRSGPVLYLRALDGKSEDTVRFVGVTDRVAGNVRGLLPVSDETIRALGPARWSADGSQLGVVASVAFDQSQVIVMRGDGHHLRTASPNGQIILSDVQWSPDGERIAYTMSTLPRAMGVDLFVTDLRTMRVTRLTTGANLGLSELRWDARGGAVYFTQPLGWRGEPSNAATRISAVHVASGETWTVADEVVGEVQGLARDGTWALVVRYELDARGALERVLARVPLGRDGEAVVLARGEGLAYAELVEGDREAIVASASSPWGGIDTWALVPLAGGESLVLPGLGANVTTVAVTRPAR